MEIHRRSYSKKLISIMHSSMGFYGDMIMIILFNGHAYNFTAELLTVIAKQNCWANV